MEDATLSASVRDAHRQFITGVTVVTTQSDGEPRGLVVNAFSSISLEPPLILVCVAQSAMTHEKLFLSDGFAVNVLAADQAQVAMQFASSGGDKFAGVSWTPGRGGAPLIDGAAAHFQATTEVRLHAYTHTIFVGKVIDAESFERAPLAYFRGELLDPAGLTPAA